jgi:hypothetical protein
VRATRLHLIFQEVSYLVGATRLRVRLLEIPVSGDVNLPALKLAEQSPVRRVQLGCVKLPGQSLLFDESNADAL